MNWIYLLHFDLPLKHARHYAGATTDLERRLKQHADGDGAKLLQHLIRIGTGWRLTNLWTTEDELPFVTESLMKSQKNGPRFCPLCRPTIFRIPGAVSYPIENLPPHFYTDVRT